MKIGKLPVSPELLAQALYLPDSAKIVGAEWRWLPAPRLELLVKDAGFPEAGEGVRIPSIDAAWLRTDYDAEPPVKLIEWGIENDV